MKTGAWLRGGRGKIAGMVAQKSSDGKGTVLRELVTPANPQTVDQMATRLAFGTVTQAASILLPIIGQTFKAQPNETLNRRRFVALNVPLLKAEAISQQAGGEINGCFRGKSSSALVPNSYIISEGSLVLPEPLRCYIESNAVASPSLDGVTFHFTVGEYYDPATVLASILQIENAQQITLVGLFTADGEVVNYIATESGDYIRDAAMRAWRLNLKQGATPFQFVQGMTSAQVQDALLAGIDQAKTSPELTSALISAATLTSTDLVIGYSLVELMQRNTGGNSLVAAGIILSELSGGAWDYSTTQMAYLKSSGSASLDEDAYHGLSFNNALIDYLGSQAASRLYTRKGGSINNI